MSLRGSLGVHAERCSGEPGPGSGWHQTGFDAGAVAIRAFAVRPSQFGWDAMRSPGTGSQPNFSAASLTAAMNAASVCRAW
jgi:hypothetical protein